LLNEGKAAALRLARVVVEFAERLPMLKLSGMILLLSMLFSSQAYSASVVHSCRAKLTRIEQTQKIRKITRCILKNADGSVGDLVEVKNEYNYTVATGKIIKRKNSYAVIVLREIFKEVKSGYPVIMKNNDSIDHWTATTSPF
jgi:hypothetical protein